MLETVYNHKSMQITPVTPQEVANENKINLNPKKAPRFDLITGEILKQLPNNGVVMLMYLFNAAFCLKYVPSILKVAEIIMIPKPGNHPNDVKL